MTESFVVLISTTAILLGSPGPAPLALAATGAVFGVKNGIPFLIGILLGLSLVIIASSAGLATLFTQFPSFRIACQIAGGLYFLYIAYKIASAPMLDIQQAKVVPSFKDGFILNLLNPKAYAAFFAIFSQFLLPYSDTVVGYIITGITCFIVAVIVDAIWLMVGSLLHPIFSNPIQAKIIRLVFSVLMVVSVIYALV